MVRGFGTKAPRLPEGRRRTAVDDVEAPEAPAVAEEKMAQHSASADERDEQESGLDELGTLVLRVWREPESADGLRIRILASDGAWEPADVTVTANTEAAVKTVSDWLAARALGQPQESSSNHPM
jgi:hypothetical protein